MRSVKPGKPGKTGQIGMVPRTKEEATTYAGMKVKPGPGISPRPPSQVEASGLKKEPDAPAVQPEQQTVAEAKATTTLKSGEFARGLEEAMTNATIEALANGVSDSNKLRELKLAARENYKKQFAIK